MKKMIERRKTKRKMGLENQGKLYLQIGKSVDFGYLHIFQKNYILVNCRLNSMRSVDRQNDRKKLNCNVKSKSIIE